MATEVGRSRPLPLVKSGKGEGNERRRRRRRRLRLAGRPAISALSSAGGSLLCSWTQDGDGRPAGRVYRTTPRLRRRFRGCCRPRTHASLLCGPPLHRRPGRRQPALLRGRSSRASLGIIEDSVDREQASQQSKRHHCQPLV